MQHISYGRSVPKQSRGGRISSAQFRYSIEQCEDFAGLEEDTKPYDLLKLVKRTGKSMGFTPAMTELLDYYMAFTREQDWQEGARPIVYQCLSKTAMDLGISERHVRRLEKQLFDLEAITWNDSGNHKRYGQRCEDTGNILYAYGVDLTPLAYLKEKLSNKLHELQMYKAAWHESKRQISWYRAQLRAIIAEMEGQGSDVIAMQVTYDSIATPIRAGMSLEIIRERLEQHKAQYETFLAEVASNDKHQITDKESAKADSDVRHYNYSINKLSNKLESNRSGISFQKSVVESVLDKLSPSEDVAPSEKGEVTVKTEPKGRRGEDSVDIEATGMQHISLKQVLNAASERFKNHIPMHKRAMEWRDVVEAAYAIRPHLFISQKHWGNACEALGRNGAAICLLLTDQAVMRPENPVTKPAAYFNAMIARARVGELRLHQSIFGILKREYGDPANSNADTDTTTTKTGR